jgi:hypothetical protein
LTSFGVSQINESIVEDAALTWCGGLGYAVGHGPHRSRTLATLRDTLLPKLLSGEMRVATGNNSRTNHKSDIYLP